MSVTTTVVSRFCPNCHQSYGFKEQHVCPVAQTTEQATVTDPLIGAVLGERYKIESYLSSGGMGIVYKARHIVLDKPIAIKLLREAQDEDAQQRFLLEAKSACHIGHEHIVDITDFGVLEDGHAYLVMEFLQGKTLEAVIRNGALPPRRVCRIGEQIARGLQAVHEKGILHRDLKPGNIFLLDRQKRDFVKILDFGIAKVMAGTREALSEKEMKPLVNMRATTQGTVLGTPEYLSPEQAAGEPIDARVDQYALGCILYEMLTGDVPFRGNGPMSTLMKHLTEKPVPPRQRCPELNIPESLEQIVLKAMANKRENRYANMEELAQALQTEVEGNASYLGESSAVIPLNPGFSGLQPQQTGPNGASSAGQPGGRRPSSSGMAVTTRSQIDGDRRSSWIWRGLGAAAGLLVVGGVLLVMQLRTPSPRKVDGVGLGSGQATRTLPSPPKETSDGGVQAADSEPKTKPGSEPTETLDPDERRPKADSAQVKLTFANESAVQIALTCSGQKPVVIAPRKTVPIRLAPSAARCDATAPGYTTQGFVAAELRKSAKKGKTKVVVKLVPGQVPNLSIIKKK